MYNIKNNLFLSVAMIIFFVVSACQPVATSPKTAEINGVEVPVALLPGPGFNIGYESEPLKLSADNWQGEAVFAKDQSGKGFLAIKAGNGSEAFEMTIEVGVPFTMLGKEYVLKDYWGNDWGIALK